MKKLSNNLRALAALTASAAVLTLAMSCGFGYEVIEDTQNTAGGEEALSRQEVLALMHLRETHDISEAELKTNLEGFFSSEAASRSAVSTTKVGVPQKFTSRLENGFSALTANRRSAGAELEASEIPFYLFPLEDSGAGNTGYALTSGDARIGGILSVVEKGDFSIDNMLAAVENGGLQAQNPVEELIYSNLGAYILNTIDIYNSITDVDISRAAGRAAAPANNPDNWDGFVTHWVDTPFMPLVSINTQWGQQSPYYDVINSLYGVSNVRENDKYLTGCVPTAMAQIAAYHEWPKKPQAILRDPIWGSNIDEFIDPYTKTKKIYKFSNIKYEWSKMKQPNFINDVAAKREIGMLMLEMGCNVFVTYDTLDGLGGSGAYSKYVPGAFKAIGYNSSSLVDYSFDAIQSSITEKKPVYARASSKESGHAWVIDDFKIGIKLTNLYIPFFYTRFTVVSRYDFVHCNFGWEGSDDGWYISGIFDTNQGPAITGMRSMDDLYNFQYNHQIIPDITCPNCPHE